MNELLQVLSVTLPIFILVAMGFLATKKEILPAGSNKALAAFAVNFALPAILFRVISAKRLSVLFQADFFLAYGAGSLAS